MENFGLDFRLVNTSRMPNPKKTGFDVEIGLGMENFGLDFRLLNTSRIPNPKKQVSMWKLV